jgi:prephenate dehydrogenase
MTMAHAPIGSVAIVGFGLIGASLARALKQRDDTIQVHALDLAGVASGLTSRDATTITSVDDVAARNARIADCDLTVLAGPVSAIVEQLPEMLTAARLVTDCGSTKRRIVETAGETPNAERFVPGHPMAGGNRGGADAARADLFAGRPWVLCPSEASSSARRLVEDVVRFVGATPIDMSAPQHDAAVALTSHVPRLLASLLTTMSHDANADGVQGPAFERITRAASGPVSIWRDIFESNADEVAIAARALGGKLTDLAAELERGNLAALEKVLAGDGETE